MDLLKQLVSQLIFLKNHLKIWTLMDFLNLDFIKLVNNKSNVTKEIILLLF